MYPAVFKLLFKKDRGRPRRSKNVQCGECAGCAKRKRLACRYDKSPCDHHSGTMRPPPVPHDDTADFAAENPAVPNLRGVKRKRRVALVDPHRYDWLDKHLSSCGKELVYNVGLRNSSAIVKAARCC